MVFQTFFCFRFTDFRFLGCSTAYAYICTVKCHHRSMSYRDIVCSDLYVRMRPMDCGAVVTSGPLLWNLALLSIGTATAECRSVNSCALESL